MKKTFFILLITLTPWFVQAQRLWLSLESKIDIENKAIDSIGYQKDFVNAKAIVTYLETYTDKLQKSGYLSNQIGALVKTNDSTFVSEIKLGKKTEIIHIYIGNILNEKIREKISPDSDTIKLNIREIENFQNNVLQQYYSLGFPLTKTKIIDLKTIDNHLVGTLKVQEESKRQINTLVLEGYEAFPKGYHKNLARKYKNLTFNQQNLDRIHADFEKIGFVNQIKFPDILFKEDSTAVYVYLEKNKANKFDGYVGFSNDDEDKIRFNGYLDFMLWNALNTGEEFKLYWRNDGNQQTTFNASLYLPFIFSTPFDVKSQLQIFKQDSSFQNTATKLNIGYLHRLNTRFSLGIQTTTSVDIQNANTISLQDYKARFTTLGVSYFKRDNLNFLFPEKTNIALEVGTGKRMQDIQDTKQNFMHFNANHHLYLNSKNSIFIKSDNYYLYSNTYIVNELYRFGGIYSIRGFNENSLQANVLGSMMTEYRYLLSSGFYIHTITDVAYFEDKATGISDHLLGVGIGMGLQTGNGLFNLVYANGNSSNQAFKASNAIIHISFKAIF